MAKKKKERTNAQKQLFKPKKLLYYTNTTEQILDNTIGNNPNKIEQATSPPLKTKSPKHETQNQKTFGYPQDPNLGRWLTTECINREHRAATHTKGSQKDIRNY